MQSSRTDVVFSVLDALEGRHGRAGTRPIAGESSKERKTRRHVFFQGFPPNKWDLVHAPRQNRGAQGYDSERDYRKKNTPKELFERLFFPPGAALVLSQP